MSKPRLPNWPAWVWFVLIIVAAILVWSALNIPTSG